VIIVDTGVWADWFNGHATPAVDRLAESLGTEDIGVSPLILTEVLQGFRQEAGFELARVQLLRLPQITLDVPGHVEAARLFRALRRRGVTVRGVVDCIIAQTCIVANAELLTADRDFTAISRHSRLRLCATA
jgi:predicted nucleic acid-binding protein